MPSLKINYSLPPLNVLSFGAGKQSTLLLLEALENKFTFKLDYAIFSDTGNEPRYVYEHLEFIKRYVWTHYKFKIHIVSAGNIYDDCILHAQQKTNWSPTPPLWHSRNSFLRRQCTGHLKIRPIRKFCHSIANQHPIRMWIGISYDEMERMKKSDVKYVSNYYPYVETKRTLYQIKETYKKIGVPEPGKSSCVICPFHSFDYWSKLKIVEPDSFESACVFDEKIRNLRPNKPPLYLNRSCMPLRSIDFHFKNSLFPEMIEECEGLCGL